MDTPHEESCEPAKKIRILENVVLPRAEFSPETSETPLLKFSACSSNSTEMNVSSAIRPLGGALSLLSPISVGQASTSSATSLISPPLLSPGSTQTEMSLSSGTPRKDKLRKTLKKLRNDNSLLKKQNQKLKQQFKKIESNIKDISLKEYMSLTNKFCPKDLANFINVQVSQIQKHPKGRRYSLEYKNECLAMYFTGPKLYKKKLMTKYCLPTPTTLLKQVNKLKVKPGLNNPEIFTTLKLKIDSFSEDDKLCMLCMDEMNIKANLFYATGSDVIVGLASDSASTKTLKPALTASVFMIRGLKNKWIQPISYNFYHSTCPSSSLKRAITEIIIKLKEIGLKVCVLISDMGSNNIQLMKLLKITPEKPHFSVENENIVYMFDTPISLKH